MAVNRVAKWSIGAVVALVVLIVGGTYVYIHFIKEEAPPELAITPGTSASSTTAPGSSGASSTTATGGTTAASSGVDGDWTPTDASTAGYRVKEILFGQSTTAVGRTNQVSGQMTIAGTTLSAARFEVDMASVASDESRRDGRFRDSIMDTAQFPTSTFELSSPVDFGAVPSEGTVISAKATGKLTLRGTTKDVTFDLKADRKGDTIEVNGSLAIHFPDWGIPNPTMGPAQVGDDGTLEFLIVLARKS